MIKAFIKNNQAYCEVQRLVGITDYEQMFGQGVKSFEGNNFMCKLSCFSNCSIQGIRKAQSIRITARADGTGCDVYYKDEASRSGWFPRPTQSSVYTPMWKSIFKHPTDELQGHPVSAIVTPIQEKGQRQSWQYLVTYFGDFAK